MNLNQAQAKVREFHKAFGLLANDRPQMVSDADLKLRWELINEEAAEFQEAAEGHDLVEMADAIADLLYVVLGAAEALGLEAEPFFNEVHRSNMTKVWPDGTVHKSDFGKVLKPETYSRADIRKELNRQCSNALGKILERASGCPFCLNESCTCPETIARLKRTENNAKG